MGKIARVNDIDIWWEDFGKKSNPTVLLIMGAGANCMQWPVKFIEGLVANDLHVVRFDNRDVGKSTWLTQESFSSRVVKRLPLYISTMMVNFVFKNMLDEDGNFKINKQSKVEYNLHDMAKDAIALMDHLNISKAHIVGASMGGMISQIIGMDYSERALTITPIMSSPGIDSTLSGPTPKFMEALEDFLLLNIQGRIEDGRVRLYEGLSGSRFPFDEKKFREHIRAAIAHGNNPFNGHGDAVGITPIRTKRLYEIKAPTLVIHGTEDPILPLDHGMALVNNIPNAKKYIMEGVGHEMPSELLPEMIAEMTALFKQTK
mmetsp:Transcript_56430/g.63983  ORF Transcript_56430/g.63983 Transcript_56430/m.63983 type:complete len:317 (+) Transcript_56430:129-1079(+)